MKVAIYCRVSTDDKGQDPVMQLEACKEYCIRNKHEIIAELTDEGVTGNSWYFDRPKGKELKKLIDRHSIQGIICFAVDRFSRQNPLKLLPSLNDLKDRGIVFVSVTEPIFNMEGSVAEPMRYMLTWFSSYFLEQHRTKVNAGMDKARKFGTKSGKAIGKPRSADYDLICKMYDGGKGISQIARELNASKSTVSNAIKKRYVAVEEVQAVSL